MNKDMLSKTLIMGIVLLFFGISITPTIGISISFDDTTPPVTTISLNGTASELGVFTSDVEVTLNATDDMSGVNVTYYDLNAGGNEIYYEPFMVTGHGSHAIAYLSIDNAGNIEEGKVAYIEIDFIPPEIDLYWDKLDNKSIKFEPYVSDEGSGLYKVEYYIDNICMYTGYYGDMLEWIWTPNATGRYLATGIVYDEAGHSDRDDKYIEITTSNTLVKEFIQIQNEVKPRTIDFSFLERFPIIREVILRLINPL